ncbi:unnamed protein product [Adineta steineri]|uniref:Uncharacterized protein n=1 Tax=Adineta steineri TaxID=433720 RepID=A0A819FJ20_9BILA|nr:unnamed protein product [Adineta steineri]
MSNYLGRKPEFTPAVYTRYFEQKDTPKSSAGHIYFNEDNEETSKNYQIKRDLIFKRLFPSKYAESNNNTSETDEIHPNRTNNSTNEPLGDFISLSNNDFSTLEKQPSSPLRGPALILTSSDEDEEESPAKRQLPTIAHETIIGHVHPRKTIENVRAILIRELYERTSDPHTEWLKCKMEISRDYINPKYYADFQRRYKKDMKRTTAKKIKSTFIQNNTDNGYSVYDSTKINETKTTKLKNDDIIETSTTTKRKKLMPPSSPIVISNDSSNQSKSPPEYIVLDSSDEDDNPDQDSNSTYFIDRSSTSYNVPSEPTETFTEDYNTEDSKYAQLPSRSKSFLSISRPIISKHQKRKKNISKNPSKPLVSAIDRIIDHMDNSDTLSNSTTKEQQNLLLKQIKKRKKKKKKQVLSK